MCYQQYRDTQIYKKNFLIIIYQIVILLMGYRLLKTGENATIILYPDNNLHDIFMKDSKICLVFLRMRYFIKSVRFFCITLLCLAVVKVS